ncbi:Diaminopimelate epimerase-like protein [Polyplosphaeria fusca]|uniref:Diaminopimelate epimerase-like protein n=1 Tax=Polyplosphaeria fusca TaxID=682080 RepID=A0A9P4UYP6_9PLEO|nr:Diaminopimelate epimerase-like protein [Polyplosphaeria fusca]
MAPTQLHFVTLDVFTNTRYEGNPLAVVELPPSVELSQEQKQDIAREFNLSETTFFHLQDDGADSLTWTVDIFMTTKELPFAGHPTIGTACHALSKAARSRGTKEGVIEGRFNIKAGPIFLRYDIGTNLARAAIPHDVHIHQRKWSQEELSSTQASLATAAQKGQISLREEYPIVSIVKGMAFVLIELESTDALGLVATTAKSTLIDGLDEGWNDTFVGTYFFTRLPDGPDGTKCVRTRMIEGALEDPATGSAASDLAAYLALVEGKPGKALRYAITQGVEMGRRSEIGIEVVLAKDGGISDLYLEGCAVPVMEGTLTVGRGASSGRDTVLARF